MSLHTRARAFRRSFRAALTIGGLLGALTLLSSPVLATAATAARTAASAPCIGTAQGAPWSQKGQKGTLYTVLGVNGASCSTGKSWLKRITSSHGDKHPAGWKCLATSGVGECQTKGGGIFEFGPKLKK